MEPMIINDFFRASGTCGGRVCDDLANPRAEMWNFSAEVVLVVPQVLGSAAMFQRGAGDAVAFEE